MAKQPVTAEEAARSAELARERQRRYEQKPETKAKRNAYYMRPEVQARYKARHATDAHKQYMRDWRSSEAGKAVTKAGSLKHSTKGTVSLELWAALVALQGGACAICRRPFDALGYRDVHADHCHDELKPRGLLCRNCNHAEGQIRKTGLTPEEFCRRMAAYLSAPPAASVQLDRVDPERKGSHAVG